MAPRQVGHRVLSVARRWAWQSVQSMWPHGAATTTRSSAKGSRQTGQSSPPPEATSRWQTAPRAAAVAAATIPLVALLPPRCGLGGILPVDTDKKRSADDLLRSCGFPKNWDVSRAH